MRRTRELSILNPDGKRPPRCRATIDSSRTARQRVKRERTYRTISHSFPERLRQVTPGICPPAAGAFRVSDLPIDLIPPPSLNHYTHPMKPRSSFDSPNFTPPSALTQPTNPLPPDTRTVDLQQSIAAHAYALWQSYGQPENRALAIWLEAERQLLGADPHVNQPTTSPGAVAAPALGLTTKAASHSFDSAKAEQAQSPRAK